MTWFIVCWIVGAIASWIGTTVYIKNRTTWTWKGFIEVAKANMESPLKEALKWLLYMVAWPIEIAAVLYGAIYLRYWTRIMIKNFEILDREES